MQLRAVELLAAWARSNPDIGEQERGLRDEFCVLAWLGFWCFAPVASVCHPVCSRRYSPRAVRIKIDGDVNSCLDPDSLLARFSGAL